MTDYEIFEIKLEIALSYQAYEANLITEEMLNYATEKLRKRLIDI